MLNQSLKTDGELLLFVDCLTSQPHAVYFRNVSAQTAVPATCCVLQEWVCSDCCTSHMLCTSGMGLLRLLYQPRAVYFRNGSAQTAVPATCCVLQEWVCSDCCTSHMLCTSGMGLLRLLYQPHAVYFRNGSAQTAVPATCCVLQEWVCSDCCTSHMLCTSGMGLLRLLYQPHASVLQERVCSDCCTNHMLVYFRNGSAQTAVRAATLTQKLQTKLFISPTHRILTPCQPFPTLTPGRVATGITILKSLVCLSLEKRSTKKAGIEPRSAAVEEDAMPLGQRGGQRK